MTDLLIDLIILIAVLAALYGVGRTITARLSIPWWAASLEMAASMAVGVGVVATLLFVFALLGWFVPLMAWLMLGAGLALAAVSYRVLWADLNRIAGVLNGVWRGSWFMKLALLLTAGGVLIILVGDLAPTMEGDSVHQYLLLPRYWAEAGRYVQPTHIWASTLPGNSMMLSGWALLMRPGNHALPALITGFGMSLIFALSVYAFARLYLKPGAAFLALMAAYTMPTTNYLASSAKVDMGWAIFETLALAFFFKWLDNLRGEGQGSRHWQWLALSGAMLGWAAGSKNQTMISMLLLGLWVIADHVMRRDLRALVPRAALFGGAAILTMLPFYLYNGIVHLNPVYPVFAETLTGLWGGTISPRSELGTEVFYPWTVGGYFTNLWNASLGHRPDFYLGFIAGPVFLLAIPAGALLGVFRGKKEILRGIAYALIFAALWLVVKQAARHFIPGLVVLSLAAGYALAAIDREFKAPGGTTILIFAGLCIGWNLLIGAGTLLWNGAYRVTLGLETREEYITRWHDDVITNTFPDSETLAVLNTLGPDTRILSEHANSSLYITPDLVSATWGDRFSYNTQTNSADLLADLEAHGIGYIQTYVTDPPGPELFNTTTFLEAHTELIYEGPRTRLYRILYSGD